MAEALVNVCTQYHTVHKLARCCVNDCSTLSVHTKTRGSICTLEPMPQEHPLEQVKAMPIAN